MTRFLIIALLGFLITLVAYLLRESGGLSTSTQGDPTNQRAGGRQKWEDGEAERRRRQRLRDIYTHMPQRPKKLSEQAVARRERLADQEVWRQLALDPYNTLTVDGGVARWIVFETSEGMLISQPQEKHDE